MRPACQPRYEFRIRIPGPTPFRNGSHRLHNDSDRPNDPRPKRAWRLRSRRGRVRRRAPPRPKILFGSACAAHRRVRFTSFDHNLCSLLKQHICGRCWRTRSLSLTAARDSSRDPEQSLRADHCSASSARRMPTTLLTAIHSAPRAPSLGHDAWTRPGAGVTILNYDNQRRPDNDQLREWLQRRQLVDTFGLKIAEPDGTSCRWLYYDSLKPTFRRVEPTMLSS